MGSLEGIVHRTPYELEHMFKTIFVRSINTWLFMSTFFKKVNRSIYSAYISFDL